MSTFNNFVTAIQKQLSKMAKTGLFEVDLDKDLVWNTYLDSFPAGTNVQYRERREYDCNCCKQFIRDVGRVVTFVENKKVSVWDIQVGGYYQEVVDVLAKLIRGTSVGNEFLHFTPKVGTATSNVLCEDSTTVRVFHHFHAVLPREFVKPAADIASLLNDTRGNVQVLNRSLEELSSSAAETILELNAQGSLYRGNEQVASVTKFLTLKREFDALPEDQKEGFIWSQGKKLGAFGKFRNTAIGTLLQDLSEGMDLESAVKRWEKVMAPANYKRPTALVTEAMIKKAQATVDELGIQDSLPRRYAVLEDIKRNNVLFADRTARKSMGDLSSLLEGSKKAKAGPSSVEEISIEQFLEKVLPTVTSVEAFVENRMSGNLVSLVAPIYPDAPNILKWNNNFSWSYNGEVTDSIKERVKAAGGNVEGELRISLSWHNGDDLDLHVHEPSGDHLYFGTRSHKSHNGGHLDVDMNAGGARNPVDPVENIIYPHGKPQARGTYKVRVHNYSQRDFTNPQGYEVEVEYKGEILTFVRPKNQPSQRYVDVVEFVIGDNGLEVVKSIGHTKQSREVWGVSTEKFHKVDVVMNSPNHWDGENTGNKHYFFMLEGCANPQGTRGFYNEYLRQELVEHRKVFEHLGGALKVEHSTPQLAGIGFSDTKRDELLVKVTGQFTRLLKIKF